MDTEKIELMLNRCDLKELQEIQNKLKGIISRRCAEVSVFNDDEGRKKRSERRFNANLVGTLTRITDVKPGERKEYSVTVEDVSKSGMRLRLDMNFTPSRVVEVAFASPGGKIKHCFLEVVRMKKIESSHGDWLEVGCSSINHDEVRRLRIQEEDITKIRNTLQSCRGLLIALVGNDTEVIEKSLVTRIKSQHYRVCPSELVDQAMEYAVKKQSQLVIFCQGSKLVDDSSALDELKAKSKTIATLAIIEKEEHRRPLLMAGVDECLLESSCDAFLFESIDRALVGHTARHGINANLSTRAIVASSNNTCINLVSYQLQENGYNVTAVTNLAEAQRFAKDHFDLVFVDFDPHELEVFEKYKAIFEALPIVAMCSDISIGQDALLNGAHNYLCMPPTKKDIHMILQSSRLKPEAAPSGG